ncbi:MAG: hypothetical protein O2807_12480 [bacterium]|nr:hypothetical protein [bacterium]
MGPPIRTLILGAAGRDFQNFNVCYRDDAPSSIFDCRSTAPKVR